jgi:hypothetical protein
MKLFCVCSLLSSLCFSQKFTASVGGDFSRGNVNILNVDMRMEIRSDSGRREWSISPSQRFTYLTLKREILNNETYVSSFLENKYSKWKILFFNENERSYNRKIDYRGNLGMGISYHVLRKENLKLDISEALLPEVFLTSEIERYVLRLSTRVKFIHRTSQFSISSVTVVQPSVLNHPSVRSRDNFVLRSQNSTEFFISKKFSVIVGADLVIQTYPSYLNPAIRSTDVRFYTSLRFRN